MIQRIWEQNKPFILMSGGGLAVFLLLNYFVSSYVESADRDLKRAAALAKKSRQLKKELKGRYWELKQRLEKYATYQETLRKEIELPPEQELAALDKKSLLVQFNLAIDRVWAEALERANRQGLVIPDKLGPEHFDIQGEDSPEKYERHYYYLGIVRRALFSLVDSGMVVIKEPEPIDDPPIEIPGDPDTYCVVGGWGIKVEGSYASFVNVLKSVQKPGDWLQVRVTDLTPKDKSGEGDLKGELEFLGVRLESTETLAKQGLIRGKKSRFKRRGG